MTDLITKPTTLIAGTALLAAAAATISSSRADRGHGTGDIGQPADAAAADRTIEIVLGDNYFEPAQISVQEGETIHFVLRNDGELLHEFNIGTAAMHAEHQVEMMTMMQHGLLSATGLSGEITGSGHHGPDGSADMMMHADPNSVLVEPGAVEELGWTFANATELEFACNLPGHYQDGMHGPVRFGN